MLFALEEEKNLFAQFNFHGAIFGNLGRNLIPLAIHEHENTNGGAFLDLSGDSQGSSDGASLTSFSASDVDFHQFNELSSCFELFFGILDLENHFVGRLGSEFLYEFSDNFSTVSSVSSVSSATTGAT